MNLRTWMFYWSPEGRPIGKVYGRDLKAAWKEFKRKWPRYAKYRGEVYAQERERES